MNRDAGVVIKLTIKKSTLISQLNHIYALIKKDLLLEIRQQYTFYGVLLYVASTVFVLYLAMGQPEEKVWNGLFCYMEIGRASCRERV